MFADLVYRMQLEERFYSVFSTVFLMCLSGCLLLV